MTDQKRTNLFISVVTYDNTTGKPVASRIVDMFHIGTRNWLQSHLWWAMHQGHSVETNVCTEQEIAEYTSKGAQQLAEKFNKNHSEVAAA